MIHKSNVLRQNMQITTILYFPISLKLIIHKIYTIIIRRLYQSYGIIFLSFSVDISILIHSKYYDVIFIIPNNAPSNYRPKFYTHHIALV